MTGRRRKHWRGERVHLSFRVTPSLHAEMKRHAKEAKVTMNDYAAGVLGWFIEQRTAGHQIVAKTPHGERELWKP